MYMNVSSQVHVLQPTYGSHKRKLYTHMATYVRLQNCYKLPHYDIAYYDIYYIWQCYTVAVCYNRNWHLKCVTAADYPI